MVLSHILQFWRIWRIPLRSHSRFMLPKKYRAKWFKNTGSSWSEHIYRFTDLFRNILYHQNPMMSSESECFRTWVITGWVFPTNMGMSSNEYTALPVDIHGCYGYGVQYHHHLSVQRPRIDPQQIDHQSYVQILPFFSHHLLGVTCYFKLLFCMPHFRDKCL